MAADDRQLTSYWLPTQDAVARWRALMPETNLHRHPREGGPSLSEIAWMTGDSSSAISSLPQDMTSEIMASMVALLAPWPDGRYTQAFQRSGGILNLFRPLWRGEREPVWEAMRSMWKVQTKERRDRPWFELQQAWNHTPLPVLSGLSPAQAMVGIGPQEADLSFDFLAELERNCAECGFADEDEALQVSVDLFDDWQEHLAADGHSLLETVLAERSALLARRAELLGRLRLGL